jgi:hypothetical protein
MAGAFVVANKNLGLFVGTSGLFIGATTWPAAGGGGSDENLKKKSLKERRKL